MFNGRLERNWGYLIEAFIVGQCDLFSRKGRGQS